MSIVNGTFSLSCDKCGKQHDFTTNESDFDNTSSSKRQMGLENGYTWEYNFNCYECENEIEIEYEVWEYPVGAFNNDQVGIKGGTVVDTIITFKNLMNLLIFKLIEMNINGI